jgi:hypothetical protein
MFGETTTKLVVERQAQQVCENLRDAFKPVVDFQNWLTAQSDGDLTTLGFTAADITFLRSAFADLFDLQIKYNGGAGTIAIPYSYTVNSKQIIGP